MDDRKEGYRHSNGPRALMRRAATRVRRGGEVSLREMSRSAAALAARLKSSQTSKQVGSAVESWRVLKKAADAHRRGNDAMAYRLLEPMVRSNPSDTRLVVALWRAALACDRVEDVVPFMTEVVQRLASTGKPDRAAELWAELRSAAPSARLDPRSLVRIAESLEVGDLLVQVLRDAAAFDIKDLSPGLAVRIAEMAVELDPPTALLAVRRALAAPDLHETKRTRLEQLEEQLTAAGVDTAANIIAPSTSRELQPASQSSCDDGGGSEQLPPDLSPSGPGVAHERSAESEGPNAARSGADSIGAAVDEALQAVEPARFRDLKLREAMPTRLLAEAIALQLVAGRTAHIDYTKIDAIAVAEVMDLAQHPVVVIDLLFNWSSQQDPILRAVRLRSDGFDPRMLFEAPADRAEAFRSFLSELWAHCSAVPLPDLESVRGVDVRTFETVEAYERVVLAVDA